MDFDRIFPLIIVMTIWGLSQVLGKFARKGQDPPGPDAQKTGLFNMLQNNLAALEEKSKAEEALDLDEYFQPPSQSRVDLQKMESLIERAEDALPQETAITGRETLSASPPAGVIKPRAAVLRIKPQRTKRRKLQNAVVWAEILAKPVALRDQ